MVMKSSIFWDMTPCSPLKVKLCSVPASRWFLTWFILRPWRWKRHVLPKRRFTFKGLHCVISHKIEELFKIAIPEILLNIQGLFFRKVAYSTYDVTSEMLDTDNKRSLTYREVRRCRECSVWAGTSLRPQFCRDLRDKTNSKSFSHFACCQRKHTIQKQFKLKSRRTCNVVLCLIKHHVMTTYAGKRRYIST
jgi:hypothetical protein